jgi:hypothetical protein
MLQRKSAASIDFLEFVYFASLLLMLSLTNVGHYFPARYKLNFTQARLRKASRRTGMPTIPLVC